MQQTLLNVFKDCPHVIPTCYQTKSQQLHQQINDGMPYAALGGCRINQCPELIRFKLGRKFRLIYREVDRQLIPYRLISRQSFETLVKRRCKSI